MNIPETTTHVWTDALETPYQYDLVRGVANRLGYYKQVDGVWWVYSPLTDWRKSGNNEEWFKKEIEEGFFITIKEYLKGK